jgi:hypothetical protein
VLDARVQPRAVSVDFLFFSFRELGTVYVIVGCACLTLREKIKVLVWFIKKIDSKLARTSISVSIFFEVSDIEMMAIRRRDLRLSVSSSSSLFSYFKIHSTQT